MRAYKGVSVEPGEDGRTIYTYTQSWLGTYGECPEKARRELEGTLPRYEYDFFATGTSAHSAFEYVLDSIKDGQGAPPVEDAEEIGILTWRDLLPEVTWNKYDPDTAEAFIRSCVHNWYRNVLPKLGQPLGSEIRFNEELCSDDKRIIRLQGSIDHRNADVEYVGAALVDWKTSSDPWRDQWRLKRHGIQSTVYTWAHWIQTGEILPFHYFVLLGNGDVQELTVHRNVGHYEFLQERCIQIADLIDANLACWPQVEVAKDGWGCSPKFCAAWSTCRGKYLGDKPW